MSSTTRSFVAAVRFVSTIVMVAMVLVDPDDHVAVYFVHVPPGDAAVSKLNRPGFSGDLVT
jgi:hypothetical protein